MSQKVFGVALVVVLLGIGAQLVGRPQQFLAGLGRPATEKHIRATRFIGGVAFLFVIMVLIQWFRR